MNSHRPIRISARRRVKKGERVAAPGSSVDRVDRAQAASGKPAGVAQLHYPLRKAAIAPGAWQSPKTAAKKPTTNFLTPKLRRRQSASTSGIYPIPTSRRSDELL